MSRTYGLTKVQMAKYLKRQIPDRIWKYLVDKNYVSESATYQDPHEFLAREITNLLDILDDESSLNATEATRKQRRQKVSPVRQEVLSEVLANIARARTEVRAFRSETLHDNLLRLEKVPGWLKDHTDKEEYFHAVIVRIPREYSFDFQRGYVLHPPLSKLNDNHIEGLMPIDSLPFIDPEKNSIQNVKIGRDGVLRELKSLSKELANLFSWREADATTFVLTDLTPLTSILAVGVKRPSFTKAFDGPLKPLGCLTRIELSVDPMTTPRELAAAYARVRAQLVNRRIRSSSEKHMRLAACLSEHPELSQEHMRQWNAQHPKWRYRRFSLFAKDARVAFYRLVQVLPIDWKFIELPIGRPK